MALTQITTDGIKDGTITGTDLATSFATTGDFTFTGANYNVLWDKSDNALEFAANAKAVFAGDLTISHTGDHGNIVNTDGNLNIKSQGTISLFPANNNDGITIVNGGAVSLFHSNVKKFETTSAGVSVTGNIDLPDNTSGNASLRLGNSQDFFMNHNGTDSFIINNTGDLYIRDLNGDVHIQGKDNEESIIAKADGAVELYHDNGKRIETTTYGITVTGNSNNPTTDSWETNSSIITSGSYGGGIAMIDGSAGFVQSLDGNGANYYLRNATTTSTPETSIKAVANGAVELYFNGSKKFETTSYGAKFTDNVLFNNPDTTGRNLTWEADNDALHWEDNTKATFGAGNDLQIYHDTNNSIIQNFTGQLKLKASGGSGTSVQLIDHNGNAMVQAIAGGVVSLIHNNSTKLETSTEGVTIPTGNGLTINGGTGNRTGDAVLYVDKTNNSDWGAKIKSNTGSSTDYGLIIECASGSSFPLAINSGSYVFRVAGNGNCYANEFHGDGSNLTNLPGGGKILQVIHGSLNGSFGTGSGSYQATGCSASITMSGNNKVYVMAGGTVNNTSAGEGGKMTVYRGSSNIATNGNDIAGYWQEDNSNNVEQSVFLSALDTPGTGTHTYQVYIHAHGGTFYWGYRNTGVITIMEVEA